MATAKTKTAAAPAAAAGAVAGDFTPVVVHAYRRQPHIAPNAKGEMVEHAVVVEFGGEKVKFLANEDGHVVGTVASKAMFDRLVKGIPEAYIVYAGGNNLPTGPVPGTLAAKEAVRKPEGQFVLSNGDEFVVLDDMDDEDVRDFALDVAGLEPEQVPDVLQGESLKQAVFNLLQATSNNA